MTSKVRTLSAAGRPHGAQAFFNPGVGEGAANSHRPGVEGTPGGGGDAKIGVR